MSINGDYSRPVTVNGFTCRNCDDVSLAKRHVDPEHPQSGPYDISADTDPTVKAVQPVKPGSEAAKLPTDVKRYGNGGYGTILDITV